LGFDVTTTKVAKEVANNSNLIITATPSHDAILVSEWINPGTHITAIGADGFGKQELDVRLMARADVIVVDSVKHCSQYGEISGALKLGFIDESRLKLLSVAC